MFIRTCQECGHKQPARPAPAGLTDAYLNAKCRKCHSPALDFGKEQSPEPIESEGAIGHTKVHNL